MTAINPPMDPLVYEGALFLWRAVGIALWILLYNPFRQFQKMFDKADNVFEFMSNFVVFILIVLTGLLMALTAGPFVVVLHFIM